MDFCKVSLLLLVFGVFFFISQENKKLSDLTVHQYFYQSSLMTVGSKDQPQTNLLADRRFRNSKKLAFICFDIHLY